MTFIITIYVFHLRAILHLLKVAAAVLFRLGTHVWRCLQIAMHVEWWLAIHLVVLTICHSTNPSLPTSAIFNCAISSFVFYTGELCGHRHFGAVVGGRGGMAETSCWPQSRRRPPPEPLPGAWGKGPYCGVKGVLKGPYLQWKVGEGEGSD